LKNVFVPVRHGDAGIDVVVDCTIVAENGASNEKLAVLKSTGMLLKWAIAVLGVVLLGNTC
jgi:hypothetical protein